MSGKTIHNLLFSPFHFCTYLFWPAGETDLFQGFSLPVWVWFSQTNLGSNSCLTGSGVWTVLMSQGHGDPVACPQWVEACQMKGLGRRPGEGRWSAILLYPVSPLHFPCQLFNMRGWEVSWGIDSDCLPFFLYLVCTSDVLTDWSAELGIAKVTMFWKYSHGFDFRRIVKFCS